MAMTDEQNKQRLTKDGMYTDFTDFMTDEDKRMLSMKMPPIEGYDRGAELSRLIREHVANDRTGEMIISPDDGIVASDFLNESDTVKLLTAEQSQHYEMQSQRIHMAAHLSRAKVSEDDFGPLSIRSVLAFRLTATLEKFARERHLSQIHILSKAALYVTPAVNPEFIGIEATVLIKELTL